MRQNRRGKGRKSPGVPADPPDDDPVDSKRGWVSPRVVELPPLRDLTLATGGGIGGDESVFP